ncbi:MULTISPECIES: hypothetical protein [Mycobacterium]|nr:MULTISPECIES: hypothetical protein [Mycobacterium]
MSLPTVETHEWEIPSYKLDAFKAKISQANKRLAQSGLDARFEISYADFEVKKNVAHVDHSVISNHAPVYVYEPWVRATLTGPLTLRHGHFTFVARLVPEEAGITVHSAPGQELSGYSPRGDNACDHCQVERSRTRLYLVRDDRDGSIIQLGHSCIELYTGVSPKGLWALTFDEELACFARDDLGGGFGPRHYGAPVDVVLAYAFAHSDKGAPTSRPACIPRPPLSARFAPACSSTSINSTTPIGSTTAPRPPRRPAISPTPICSPRSNPR